MSGEKHRVQFDFTLKEFGTMKRCREKKSHRSDAATLQAALDTYYNLIDMLGEGSKLVILDRDGNETYRIPARVFSI